MANVSIYLIAALFFWIAGSISTDTHASESKQSIEEVVQHICDVPQLNGRFHPPTIRREKGVIFKYIMWAFVWTSIEAEFSEQEMRTIRDILYKYKYRKQHETPKRKVNCFNELLPLIRKNVVLLDDNTFNLIHDSVTCNGDLRVFREPDRARGALTADEGGLLRLYNWFKDYLSSKNYFHKDMRHLECNFLHSGLKIIHSIKTKQYPKNYQRCHKYFSSTNFIKINGKRVLDPKARFEFIAVACIGPVEGKFKMDVFDEVLEVTQWYDGKIVERLDPTEEKIKSYHPPIMRH